MNGLFHARSPRARWTTGVFVVLLAAGASPASATPFTFVSVSAGGNGDQSTSFGAQTLSASDATDDGSASASAHADFGTLGVVAAGAAFDGSVFPAISSDAEAMFNDEITIVAPGVDTALVTFSLALNGNCVFTGGATGGFPNAGCLGQGSLFGPPQLGIGVSDSNPAGAVTLLLSTNVVIPIGGALVAKGFAWNGSYLANYANTLHTFVFSPTPGVVITSASGHDYSPTADAIATPEPASLFLLGGGLLGLGGRIRSHRKRRSTGAALSHNRRLSGGCTCDLEKRRLSPA